MNNELQHHGILGQKWGVRRFQNYDGTLTARGKKRIDRSVRAINSMYDHSNKWTNRKIEKLNRKGKTAKAAVMNYMIKSNQAARTKQISDLKSIKNNKELMAVYRRDLADVLFGGQSFGDTSYTHLSGFLNRATEYNIQRGMRWCSNWTKESTLARMSPEEGYQYLRRKAIVGAASDNSRAAGQNM